MAQQDTDKAGVVRLKTRPQFLFVRNGRTERRKSLVVQARTRQGAEKIGAGFTATKSHWTDANPNLNAF